MAKLIRLVNVHMNGNDLD